MALDREATAPWHLANGKMAGGSVTCLCRFETRQPSNSFPVQRSHRLRSRIVRRRQSRITRRCLVSSQLQKYGTVRERGQYEKPDLPLKDFFYHNGYSAFARTGPGILLPYMDLFDCQPELDEHVFIDDERSFPDNSWNGTGHEDLFDMAWGHSPFSAPMTSGGSQKFEEVNVKLFWNDQWPFVARSGSTGNGRFVSVSRLRATSASLPSFTGMVSPRER